MPLGKGRATRTSLGTPIKPAARLRAARQRVGARSRARRPDARQLLSLLHEPVPPGDRLKVAVLVHAVAAAAAKAIYGH